VTVFVCAVNKERWGEGACNRAGPCSAARCLLRPRSFTSIAAMIAG